MPNRSTHLAFPWHVEDQRVGTVSDDNYVDQLIEQVLFTIPGERVNRPDFGSGVELLVFQPDGSTVATAAQHSIQASLQTALAGVVTVESLSVASDRAQMSIAIVFRRADGVRRTVTFDR